jgi:hypothetical protein
LFEKSARNLSYGIPVCENLRVESDWPISLILGVGHHRGKLTEFYLLGVQPLVLVEVSAPNCATFLPLQLTVPFHICWNYSIRRNVQWDPVC